MHVLDLHKPALEALSKPVAEWFAEPGNPVRALLWAGALALSLASWLSPSGTFFNQMLPDFISISIAVIVIDELVAYRNRLERKQEIFEQLYSPVPDVAVEALRLVQKNGWWEEVDKGNLSGVRWPGAYLDNTNLQEADLENAYLQGTFLRNANLQKANLRDAFLQGAKLSFVDLRDANLEEASLRGVHLYEAKLQKSLLAGADLQEANLGFANLQEARLWGAILVDADLGGANLQEAYLMEADLRRANLNGSDLSGADLERANLKEAKFNQDTRWPTGFDPTTVGAIEVRWDRESTKFMRVEE